MQVIAHNLTAQYTNRQLSISSNKKAKSAEKLSSGYRINRSADDAAGLKISEKMRSQIRGLSKGQDNIMEGVSWLQTGDGAMSEVSEMLHRMTELCVQAANDTNIEEDRDAISQELAQLRKEIDRIGYTTEFNHKKIFQNEEVMMDVDGGSGKTSIFNASYDDTTGQVEYGGFIFDGNRVTWNTVDPNMVYIDATTGEQAFHAGTYTYVDANYNKFQIKCTEGAKVPDLTRIIEVKASSTGITIDGIKYPWSDLKDELGKGASVSNVHDGVWTLEHGDATIAFCFPSIVDNLPKMADAINSCSTSTYSYKLVETYVGATNEQAVDALAADNINVTNSLAQLTPGNSVSFTLRADETGIWLEANGATVSGSLKSWSDMGITSWDSGNSIKGDFTYTYCDDEGTNDTNVKFDFTLSNITSVDSVIDGLDGVHIGGSNFSTHYDIEADATLDSNLLKLQTTYRNGLTFQEEKALGRDFDQQTDVVVVDQNTEYDNATGNIILELKDASDNEVLTYTGSIGLQKAEMTSDINQYLDSLVNAKVQAALAGKDPQTVDIGTKNLTDIVGSSNITTAGYFDGTVTIDDSSMEKTDGTSSFNPGIDGNTYPTAFIDFSGLGSSYTLDDLYNSGFNSTCKTCSNHYSIVFTDVNSGDDYSLTKDGQNYTLEIDIDYLKNRGVVNGSDLTSAIIDITSQVFDFHYTQYAAEGSKLYVYDDRTSMDGVEHATFDTFPFNPIDIGEYQFYLTTGDGRSIGLEYTYNYKDIADDVIVSMKQDNSGTYVKNADGTYSKYSEDDPFLDSVPVTERYKCEPEYFSKDNLGNTVSVTRDEMVSDYCQSAIEKMIGATEVDFNAIDYTTVAINGEEKDNTAVRSLFDISVEPPEPDKGINIQCSASVGDSINIPRFQLNTLELKLYRVNVSNHEKASESISIVANALNKLLEKRSSYGAYQNRLEHTYASRANAEENTQAAESRIRDTDMASEMVEYSKHSILEQAGQSMLAQANQSVEAVLSLLQ